MQSSAIMKGVILNTCSDNLLVYSTCTLHIKLSMYHSSSNIREWMESLEFMDFKIINVPGLVIFY
jgi:hypothetical protein